MRREPDLCEDLNQASVWSRAGPHLLRRSQICEEWSLASVVPRASCGQETCLRVDKSVLKEEENRTSVRSKPGLEPYLSEERSRVSEDWRETSLRTAAKAERSRAGPQRRAWPGFTGEENCASPWVKVEPHLRAEPGLSAEGSLSQ